MPWTKLVADVCKTTDVRALKGGRALGYGQAIHEAFSHALEIDERVFVMGEGADDPAGIFGATRDLHKRFGPSRVFDLPLAESACTGFAVGAAICGMRPVYIHQRMDFMLLTLDQIVNHAAKWRYMFGGQQHVPLVVACIIGRGWGSAAQHSQALEGMLINVPGVKLVYPATPYDAKGLLLASISDNDPVVFVMHRWLFNDKGAVPKDPYLVPLGKAKVCRAGRDVTILAYSLMLREAFSAAAILQEEHGIDAEVVDLRTLAPLDEDTVIASAKKTGRVIIASLDWKTGGVGSEIASRIMEKAFGRIKAPIERVSMPDCPTPGSFALEKEFYKGAGDIVKAARKLCARTF